MVRRPGRLPATRLRRRLAKGKRAQTGLLLKALCRTRRAPEPYRWAAIVVSLPNSQPVTTCLNAKCTAAHCSGTQSTHHRTDFPGILPRPR